MFRKKNPGNDSGFETKSRHKIGGFDNISSIFKGNSDEIESESVIESSVEEPNHNNNLVSRGNLTDN